MQNDNNLQCLFLAFVCEDRIEWEMGNGYVMDFVTRGSAWVSITGRNMIQDALKNDKNLIQWT